MSHSTELCHLFYRNRYENNVTEMSYFVKFCNKILKYHHKLLHLVHYLWKNLNQPFSQCKM